MKYTSSKYSIDITRIAYLHDKLSAKSLIRKNVFQYLEKYHADEAYDDDLVAIITPHSHSIDYHMKITSIGAGTTAVGSSKEDHQIMYSFAKFKHSTPHRKKLISYYELEDVKEDASLMFGMNFKDDEAASKFGQVFEFILNGLQQCDQSIYHMMAKYAAGYDIATSKGNCGITRNVRNIYTIDCDEAIPYSVLESILTMNRGYSSWDNVDPKIVQGVEKISDVVYRIYELTGALPQLVYNTETSHFQLQYLMANPCYVTIDKTAAMYKSSADAKRDTSYWENTVKEWHSIFDRGFNMLKANNKARSIMDIMSRAFLTHSRIWVVFSDYDNNIETAELHTIGDFGKNNITNKNILKAMAYNYVPEIELGVQMFKIAKSNGMLLQTPEYILYGNAHKALGYINTDKHKFVDMDFRYCANKSLAIGTDPSVVFNVDKTESSLIRKQIIHNDDNNQFSTTDVNLLTSQTWVTTLDYLIPLEFVAFIGSLQDARLLFNDDAASKYDIFCKEHSFMYQKNISIDECKEAMRSLKATEVNNKSNSADITESSDGSEDVSCTYDYDIVYVESTAEPRAEHICNTYLNRSYNECRSHLIQKIIDSANNGRPMPRHKFDYISGLSIFHNAIKSNDKFRAVCEKYNSEFVLSNAGNKMIDDLDYLIEYIFNDIVNKCFMGTLPGTSHSDAYLHRFDVKQYVLQVDAKHFKVLRHNTKGVVSGSYAMTFWAGSTKTEVIPAMFKLLPTYIHKEEVAEAREKSNANIDTKSRYVKSIRPLIKKAWVSLLDEEFGCYNASESSLKKMCRLYQHTKYNTSSKAVGVKHVTRRELEESGVSYYLKHNQHIIDYCLNTASHYHSKSDPHYNVNKYTASIEYFIDLLHQIRQSGEWCLTINDNTVMPPIDDDIDIYGFNKTENGEYLVKDRDKIISQVKTYRYFTKMLVYVQSSLAAIDEPSEEDHIIRLQQASHTLKDELQEFLEDLRDVLSSYNNIDERNTTNANIDVESAIDDLRRKIDTYYSTLDLFEDYFNENNDNVENVNNSGAFYDDVGD